MGKSRYTDEQQKQMIADYVECQNYSAVARKYKSTPNNIKHIVSKNQDIAKLCEQKRDDNTKDLLSYIDTKMAKIQSFFDIFTDNLSNREVVNSLNLKEQATVFGIIYDKACNPPKNININDGEGVKVTLDNEIKGWSK